MKLETKISVAVAGLVVLTVLGTAATLVSVRQVEGLMEGMVTENAASVKAAEELEIALLDQRGYVSSFLLAGGDPKWLAELDRRTPSFRVWLARARETAQTEEERRIVDDLEGVYRSFDARRDQVIALYRRGEAEEARRALLTDVTELYIQAYDLCEQFIAANEAYIDARVADGRRQVRRLQVLAGVYAVSTGLLGAGALWLLLRGILRPLRQLAMQARAFSSGHGEATADLSRGSTAEVVRQVDDELRTLITDVTQTRTSLERSRSQLLTAEKLASVGKLAASVAHEIRNPLTSLKMRLFWLRGQVGADLRYQDDFRVVAEEIARLESVVRNFLEFSRPPELHVESHEVRALIDRTLELLGHRLRERGLEVCRHDDIPLPPVTVDAEQTMQVFLNLLLNAAEATAAGGRIDIRAATSDADGQPGVTVRFADTGCGIPEEVAERIFEPFFSTKEEGTGLGLSIAASIMERQGGRLTLESTSPAGTVFAVVLPAAPSPA